MAVGLIIDFVISDMGKKLQHERFRGSTRALQNKEDNGYYGY